MNYQGLSEAEASKLLKEYGLNLLPQKRSYPLIQLLFSQFRNTMALVLIIASTLSFAIGDRLDGLLILIILLLNAALGFWQEYKASRELEALRRLEIASVRVIRDNGQQEIPASSLVPGDLIVLEAGDKIPADAYLVEAYDLTVDESTLTGESLPVVKSSHSEDGLIYFGTTVTSGRGRAKILATGAKTRIGNIALNLATVKEEPTPLEATLADLTKKVGILALIIALVIFFLRIIQLNDAVQAFFTSIAILVAAVPEGLPTAITVLLALGVRRMYQQKTLVRKMSSIESLGATTVICADKTGTLTRNEMRVKEVVAEKKLLKDLLKTAVFCNSASLVVRENSLHRLGRRKNYDILGDTTEGALLIWAADRGINIDLERSRGKILQEMAFSLERRMMSVVWEDKEGITIFSKGAPEVILPLCSLSEKEEEKLVRVYTDLAAKGLRVLAFARRELDKGEISRPKAHLESNLEFVGLVGIADEAREEAGIAIKKAKLAGIKVVMVTGDNELTAKAIAQEVGMFEAGDEVLTGAQLKEMGDEELAQRLGRTRIFARVTPENKLRIVQAYQQAGEVVAVTGDGVNDALALKQAQVGVAMGTSGTDVAKEAADLVILDDNLATIVSAIEQGRLIYANILKTVRFLLTGNFSEILLLLTAALISLPTPLLPVQILWINFVTDGLPALSLAADPASHRIMVVPPRKQGQQLLDLQMLRYVLIYGVMIALIVLLTFYMVLNQAGLQSARMMAFTIMVILQMGLIFIIRQHHSIFSNKYLLSSVGLVLLLQALILTIPFLRELFKV